MAKLTVAQFLDTVRQRHNAVGDSNWSDSEIYLLLTNRINEALSFTGLLEIKDTSSLTTTAGTQKYDLPATIENLLQVDYDGEPISRIDFTQWAQYRTSSGTPTGTPTKYYPFADSIYLIPVPSESAKVITLWAEGIHAVIDGSAVNTISFPGNLIPHLVNGVVSDMYAKDLNQGMATFYEKLWQDKGIPAFNRHFAKKKYPSNFTHVASSDVENNNDTWGANF